MFHILPPGPKWDKRSVVWLTCIVSYDCCHGGGGVCISMQCMSCLPMLFTSLYALEAYLDVYRDTLCTTAHSETGYNNICGENTMPIHHCIYDMSQIVWVV